MWSSWLTPLGEALGDELEITEDGKRSEGSGQTQTDYDPVVEQPSGGVVAGPDATRILLVEDNRVNQMLAMAVLKKLGYEADLAEDGQVAVDLLSQPLLHDCVDGLPDA